jgi:uncharacterized membrane protein
LIIVGLFLLFIGTVFALQGANVIGGSAIMSGNSTYIYIGGVVAVIGLILILVGAVSRSKASPTSTREATIPSTAIGPSI